MQAFACGHCGQLLFFENSRCLRCETEQGFDPDGLTLVALTPAAQDARRCANAGLAQCNWLLAPGDDTPLCRSCRLTRTRPADADADGLQRFAAAEAAKRRLLYQLLVLGLPIGSDLSFDLLSSEARPVMTGHADGLITLDLAESDDVAREQRRAELGEPYRTLLGHFRHEVGHYYWPVVVERTGRLARCRELFGDEREDYQAALDAHYEHGPPPDWEQRFVSAYATMHPWEDWAETWAHYLHIRDTLQTAGAFGVSVAGPVASADPALASDPDPEPEDSFAAIVDSWIPLTYALNAINRSMGSADLYPFVLPAPVIEKLAFVHACVEAAGGESER